MPTNVNITVPTYSISEVPQLPTYAAQLNAIDLYLEKIKDVRSKILASRESTANPTVPYSGPDDADLATDWAAVMVADTNIYGEEWDSSIGTLGP
jgi:hypothetical protein